MQRQWMTTKMAINHQRQWKMAINHQRQWMMAVTKVAINHNQSMLQPATTPTNTNLAIATQQYHTPSKQHIAEPMSHAHWLMTLLSGSFCSGSFAWEPTQLHECFHCRAVTATSTAVIHSRSYPNPIRITSSCHTHKFMLMACHDRDLSLENQLASRSLYYKTCKEDGYKTCTDIEPQLPKFIDHTLNRINTQDTSMSSSTIAASARLSQFGKSFFSIPRLPVSLNVRVNRNSHKYNY